MLKRFIFNRICRKIREIKIQGATNVAKAALKAYYLFPSKKTKKILLSLRPTEPMLSHVIELAGKQEKEKILAHFSDSQNKINKTVFRIIKNNSTIFTHCHSTNVIKALIYAKKQEKKFRVFNTETRPLYQGRKTAKELSRAGIPVVQFIDSAAQIAIAKQTKADKDYANLVLLGADALLKSSVINKVGSGIIAEIAYDNKIPVYIVADSWKYAHKKVKLEQRDFKEIWNPKTNKIHVKNPAFEAINPKYIKGIITELGLMTYKKFLRKVK
jgi:translation initiation factor 2B subunit (eIF-2B alpha/beta/delta family)